MRPSTIFLVAACAALATVGCAAVADFVPRVATTPAQWQRAAQEPVCRSLVVVNSSLSPAACPDPRQVPPERPLAQSPDGRLVAYECACPGDFYGELLRR